MTDSIDGIMDKLNDTIREIKVKVRVSNAHAAGVQTGFALAKKTAAAKARVLGFDSLASDIEKMSVARKDPSDPQPQ